MLSFPDRLDLSGLQWPDRRKAGIVEAPHSLFIDCPNIVQGLQGFMDGCHRITTILFAHSLFTSIKSPLFNNSASCFSVNVSTCFAGLAVVIVVMGFWIPAPLFRLIQGAVGIVVGG